MWQVNGGRKNANIERKSERREKARSPSECVLRWLCMCEHYAQSAWKVKAHGICYALYNGLLMLLDIANPFKCLPLIKPYFSYMNIFYSVHTSIAYNMNIWNIVNIARERARDIAIDESKTKQNKTKQRRNKWRALHFLMIMIMMFTLFFFVHFILESSTCVYHFQFAS